MSPHEIRIEKRRPLMEMGEGVFPAFEVILADPKSEPLHVRVAIETLISMKTNRHRFIDLTVARLADPSWGVRWKALHLLGIIGSERDTAPVVALLYDVDAGIHYAAVDTLVLIGGKRDLIEMDAWLLSARNAILKTGKADSNELNFLKYVSSRRNQLDDRLKANPIPKDLKD